MELNSKDEAERMSVKGRMELTTFSQTKVSSRTKKHLDLDIFV